MGTSRHDPLRTAIQVTVYVALYFASAYFFFGPLLLWIGGYFTGTIATGFMAALFANWLALRIYEDRHLSDAGLWLNRASADNLLFGLAGGVGSACLVLAPPLLVGAAHIVRTPAEQPSAGAIVYLVFLLATGAAGEELFFRGYGFQILLARCGPYATILPVASSSPCCTRATPTPPGLASPIPPVLASCLATLFCAAATCGCPSACTSAGTSPCRCSA